MLKFFKIVKLKKLNILIDVITYIFDSNPKENVGYYPSQSYWGFQIPMKYWNVFTRFLVT